VEVRKSRVAVVTGGASGIGKAVAERLAAEDDLALILDINADTGARVAAAIQSRGQRAEFLHCDVTREGAVQNAFRQILADHSHIDVLVNVAGGSLHQHPVEHFPLEHWRAVLDLNLTSTFLCCRCVAGTMKGQRSGAIVNVSSEFGFTGAAGHCAYVAAKAGIIGFSKALALELAPFSVRVNAVAPGRIGTERIRASYTDAQWQAGEREIPLGRVGQPEDVADAVAYLTSDASRYLTGQTLHINGGRYLW
jgi:3-oxoacyl-[acyl-carrier protein] reductase